VGVDAGSSMRVLARLPIGFLFGFLDGGKALKTSRKISFLILKI
jgi:hypothetical protein